MSDPRRLVDGDGDRGQADGRAGLSTSPILRDVPDIPPQRWCEFTLAFCRCWPVIKSPTMASCSRHFLEEVS